MSDFLYLFKGCLVCILQTIATNTYLLTKQTLKMKIFKYILMVLVGGTMYGTMSSFVKLSYSHGFNAAELAFSQALLAALILGIYTLFTSHNLHISMNNSLALIFTGGTIGLTNYLYYQSVSYINASSVAIIILMQFTWFSLLLEWIFFAKKPSKLELMTVLLIVCGTVMAGGLFNAHIQSLSTKGLLLALGSSLTYAFYIVANSKVRVGVDWQLKSTLIMTDSALTIFIVNHQTIITDNHFGYNFLRWAVFLAVVGTTIPTALFAVAIPKVGAGISAILKTIELPVAILCAHLILNEQISSLQLLGIFVMLIAISAMIFSESKLSDHNKSNNKPLLHNNNH